MRQRLLIVLVLVLLPLCAGPTVAEASASRRAEATTTSSTAPSGGSTESLPGTTLEADARDDGTSPAPWFIGSGVAAAVAVAVGGTLLKRRAA
ncbi:MAG: hypothetical protein ACT4OV_10800 [Microthrixaceae bacterium]